MYTGYILLQTVAYNGDHTKRWANMAIVFSPFIQLGITVLCYLIPLVILTVILKSPWFKGIFGEFQINMAARLFLPEDEYHLIKDVTLPTGDGTTQIDHIVVSRFGVFVIETKNMKGWIFGAADQKTWTQKIYRHTSKFQNPLRQNYKHVKTLEALLNIPLAALHSVVVFVGNSTIKTAMPDNVTYARGYIRYIKSKRDVVLSKGQVEAVIAQIEQLRLQRGMATNRQHVRHLREKAKPREESTPDCPKCGSGMVLRNVRKGRKPGTSLC